MLHKINQTPECVLYDSTDVNFNRQNQPMVIEIITMIASGRCGFLEGARETSGHSEMEIRYCVHVVYSVYNP